MIDVLGLCPTCRREVHERVVLTRSCGCPDTAEAVCASAVEYYEQTPCDEHADRIVPDAPCDSIPPDLGACSETYAIVLNLHEAASHHKETCHDETCTVSLYSLKRAAQVLLYHALDHHQLLTGEAERIQQMCKEWPI